MKSMTCWALSMLIVMAGCFVLPQTALSQDGTKIHSSAENGLVVDQWQMILPEIVEEDDGRMWIRYTLPDGSYQSLPFKVGDPLTMKWFKPGHRGVSDYPAGWSIEDTQAVVDWHMSGGRGDYVIEGGDWKEVDPASAPPATASSSSSSTTSSGSTADDDCSGPYCDRPISGIQSVSTADSVDLPPPPIPDEGSDPNQALGEQVRAANIRCSEARRSGTRAEIQQACEEAERLNLEYQRKLGGG